MSQVHAVSCANCFHSKEQHHDGVCMGDLSCQCFNYIEPTLFQFAQEIEEAKHKFKSIEKRCKFILERIPQTRNAGEKTFVKIYNEIWYGFKIRKGSPQVLDADTWKRLPVADTINRAKRLVKHNNEDLKTYSPEMQHKQEVMYQAILEVVADC